MSTPEPYQQRVMEEKAELDRRRESLDVFMHGDHFQQVPAMSAKPVRICPTCFSGKFRRRWLPLRSKMEWVCARCHQPETKTDWRCPACRCFLGILVVHQGRKYRHCKDCGYFAVAKSKRAKGKD